MDNKPTYEELALAVSQCIYDELYHSQGEKGPDHFYDMFSSGYQIPAGVLRRIDVLLPLAGAEDRSIFSCEPAEFQDVIAKNKSKGPSYDMFVLAAICLLEDCPHVKYLYDILARSEIVEPDTDLPYDKGKDRRGNNMIRWTEKRKLYSRKIYSHWTHLLNNSKVDDPRIDP